MHTSSCCKIYYSEIYYCLSPFSLITVFILLFLIPYYHIMAIASHEVFYLFFLSNWKIYILGYIRWMWILGCGFILRTEWAAKSLLWLLFLRGDIPECSPNKFILKSLLTVYNNIHTQIETYAGMCAHTEDRWWIYISLWGPNKRQMFSCLHFVYLWAVQYWAAFELVLLSKAAVNKFGIGLMLWGSVSYLDSQLLLSFSF